MDDLLCTDKGDPAQKQRLTIRALKDNPPSLLEEVKDSDSLKKALAGYGDWAMVNDILGWVINTHQGTLALSSK